MNTLTTTAADLTATFVAEGVYRVEGDGPALIVIFDAEVGPECLCEGFQTTGTCIHADAADEEARVEAQEAVFAAIDADRAFNEWASAVHANPGVYPDAHL